MVVDPIGIDEDEIGEKYDDHASVLDANSVISEQASEQASLISKVCSEAQTQMIDEQSNQIQDLQKVI